MSRATEAQFDELHGLLTEAMIEQLNKYRMVGEIPPAFLAQCIKLLSENGIDSPARATKIADTLAARMPEFDPEDTGSVVPFARGSTSCQ